ncbi:MAG TPA: Hpt domain-containing protein [Povalibacter sp.]|uniref:Hpt domain-containing protein n=1 Tax=Povalibacter sp. TaxID=1962978 RepID=UPI002B65321A|nr:Hpt domain-containing protein [Povalibacter sp.]HMN47028.1 Hpt domain-containing protein [Povalibacter sp.]
MAELSSQTLHIVARELNTELNEARAALELFGDQQDNVALLRRCNEHLHAVHGALRVSEVYGAALLAEEMGQVLQYLIDNFDEKRHLAEGLDALMRSMVQLPTYLERVLSGGRDMALVLLPLLNDLRAVRGHALLSEGTLLLLNLSSDQQASPAAAAPGEGVLSVAHWARKLRTRFQLGLLGWIKGERVEQNLEVLARAAERLEQVATTQPVFQLWWVVGALIEAMREGGLEGSASIKRLLGQADRDMRRLYEQGESRYADAPSLELLNNLLYYVARAKSSGPRVSAVRASFRLSELLPVDDQVEQARESLSAPSVKLMKTVAAAIKEDLGRVKDALDLFVRRGGTQVEELSPQLELLKKIGDTLGVLGLGELRDKVQGETTDLQAIIAQQAPVNEGVLLRMAATLIKVEDSLDEQLIGMIVPTGDSQSVPTKPAGPDDIEFRQVTEAVLRECIVNMARIKEAIAQSMDRTREGQSIDQIPALVRGITAGLLMLGKTRAAEIMDGIDKALAQFVRSDGMTLPPEAVDRLADGIVAVEYYMETIQAGRADPWYMLDNAETCLRYLAETQPVPIGDGFPQTPDHARTVVIEPLSQTVAAPTEQERTAVLDRSAQVAPLPKPAPTPVSAPAPQPAAMPPAMVRPTDGDIDPEFLEIFIEEAKDEIAKLEKHFPMWDQNPQDQDSLVNVRRSFHTLKGSGRMVGAQLIGEFAWSIESLLNRVINKTLDRTPDIMGVMRSAVAAVPQLVEQIETGRAPATDVGYIMSQANNLSGMRPQAPAQAASPPAAAVTPPPAAPAAPVAPAPAQKKTVAPVMDPVLHEIYAKETAGHLATIRKFIAACDLSTPPYAVTEDLHRSCHTLSGTAKTAGAVHGTTVADPLNRYIRKLYDNSAGLTNNGLAALKDSVAAIQQVVDHINEDTGFFSNHPRIVARLQELEAELDQDIARLGETLDVGAEATRSIPVLKDIEPAPVAPTLDDTHEVAMDDADAATNVFDEAGFPSVAPPAVEAMPVHSEEVTIESVDAIEMPPTDAGDLEALEWSYANFPKEEPTVRAPKLDAGEATAQVEEISYDAPMDDGGIVVEETGVSEAIDASIAADAGFVVEDMEGLAETNRVPVLAAIHELPQQPVAHVPVVADAVEELPSEEIVIEVGEIPLESADAIAMPQLDDGSETRQSLALSIVPPPEPEPVAEALPVEPEIEAEIVAEPAVEAPVEAGFSRPADTVEERPAEAGLHSSPPAPEEPEELDDDFDPDVAAIFTEEAAELLETADSSLSAWSRDRANKALVFELKRVLHTLKGGARMAGIRAMGDLSHELETLMELVEAGQVAGDQPVFDALQTSLDTLHRMRDTVNQGGRCVRPRELISRIRVLSGHEQPAPAQPAAPVVAAVASHVVAPAVEPAPVAEAAPVIEQPVAAEAPAEESMEIEVEFGADELGAAAPRESVRIEEPAPTAVSQTAAFDVAAVAPELLPEAPPAAEPELIPAPALPPGREPQVQERQEFARVDADLLDTLLNNAGEVSIFRSRLEQQVGSIEFNLAELGRTVTRLKEQLRKLELETEAQILHRRQEEHPNRADFDPLELDRYSTIQQLTRAFAESVSDVGSIEGLLENLTREGQNLLLQQARVVTELQNGLMRTRMVPFQRHVQRLSRLVRQVATDVGKKAELVVVGAAGELDRQVLDRMLPPFEHMLRNSIVHGIETPEERTAKGKPEGGTIRVGLHREGAEMVIILEDDGRGIDVNAVRERARSRGLLQPGRVLTDEEAMQLILEPGFSTASAVTQHAGRGVGMDVVVTEIKKLGGALFTESQPGQGVKFTIRLPFTLAITQALIVRTGEELYALPLPSVEGVARVPRSEVEKHLAEETPTFNYGGQVYRFQHLGAFVGGGASTLPDGDVSVPLILIRAGEHSTAIVPDELVGSREMVVKAVGPQIATIRGISGATIMGDGRIVIILDMGALVRSEWRGRGQVEGPREDRRTFALVVDDSITVRRVTQRLLERNGMRVMTAKDGVDALSIIQEHLPDVILLDIEMPRMDGYEFATHVRADARTADIPIVMITSRTGEKHRARAIEIGVNDYLGKPYQENQLLDAIEPLVEARRRHRRMA